MMEPGARANSEHEHFSAVAKFQTSHPAPGCQRAPDGAFAKACLAFRGPPIVAATLAPADGILRTCSSFNLFMICDTNFVPLQLAFVPQRLEINAPCERVE
jgi:hypothetical protein